MKYVKLGKTDVVVPVIGQGGALFGTKIDIDYEDIIRSSIDCGISLIDTAEVYTEGASETIIGKAIRNIRDKVFLCTKISPEHLSVSGIMSSVEASLVRLGTDYIDLYQMHWPYMNIDKEKVLSAFNKIRQDGKVRFLGFSNFSIPEMEFMGLNMFVSNQIEYNIFDRLAEQYTMPYCAAHNMSIISYCPLHRGNIFSGVKSKDILTSLSDKYNKTVYQIALNYIIAQGCIVIPSSINKDHIKSNTEVLDFIIDDNDMELISLNVGAKIVYTSINNIDVSDFGFGNSVVYYTLEEAIENQNGFCPSPQELADFLLSLTGEQLKSVKPVRVHELKDGRYSLFEGRIRYWAWVIAFGDSKEVPIYILRRY